MGLLLLLKPPTAVADTNTATLPLTLTVGSRGIIEGVYEPGDPGLFLDIAWATDPLATPTWVEVSEYVRELATSRGRSFEYTRTEAGTSQYRLDNRSSQFNPDNVSGPWYPNVTAIRRMRVRGRVGGTTYPVFAGFTDGFPQEFPADGQDAVVQQTATDWWLPLNIIKFSPGTTTLTADIATVPEAGTVETIQVASEALPLPQAVPFQIQVGSPPEVERMEVTATDGALTWTVTRGLDGSTVRQHSSGATVRAEAVRFAEEPSGTRISNCLDMLGIATLDRDVDAGNSTIGASDDLAGQPILEHILLIAEAESGRVFAARDGTFTFRQRHDQFINELAPRATFGGAGIPYLATGGNRLSHDDSQIYNRIRLTISDGTIVEASDQTSNDQYFERVLEKTWPLADPVEAQAAAEYLLWRLKAPTLRLPRITLTPDVTDWPDLFAAEIGYRYRFQMTPYGGGTAVDEEVLVERIAHRVTPGRWDLSLEFTEADTTVYCRLDTTGQAELDTATTLAY